MVILQTSSEFLICPSKPSDVALITEGLLYKETELPSKLQFYLSKIYSDMEPFLHKVRKQELIEGAVRRIRNENPDLQRVPYKKPPLHPLTVPQGATCICWLRILYMTCVTWLFFPSQLSNGLPRFVEKYYE